MFGFREREKPHSNSPQSQFWLLIELGWQNEHLLSMSVENSRNKTFQTTLLNVGCTIWTICYFAWEIFFLMILSSSVVSLVHWSPDSLVGSFHSPGKPKTNHYYNPNIGSPFFLAWNIFDKVKWFFNNRKYIVLITLFLILMLNIS